MLVVTSDIKQELDEKVIDMAVEVLDAGGVVAYATDTCYGFSCDATNKAAVDRLRFLKKMPPTKPVSLMFDGLEMVTEWVNLCKNALTLASNHWPGHLTLIANKKEAESIGMIDYANKSFDTLGCRIPACAFSHRMVRGLGRPITTTSANLSGMPQAYSAYDLLKQMDGAELKPDLIIDSGVQPEVAPSTIIDVSGEVMKLVRQGELAVAV